MTTFIKSQQASDEANSLNLVDYKNYEVDYKQTQKNIDTLIAQTIKDTTARVRKVMGEEAHITNISGAGARNIGKELIEGYNECHQKVTQELNSLESDI